VRICKQRKVLTALDNTWGAGLAFKPFDLVADGSPALGVDISAHALTKYPSGGGDVLMGSVITRDQTLHTRLKLTHMRLGLGVGMNDVETILRSLPSMALRYRAHDEATRTLALWADTQPEFVQVLHPSLPGSPGHVHWKALCVKGMGGAAGLFSVMLDGRFNPRQTDAFCDALKLFKLGYSWGGPISLVVPYQLDHMRTNWPPHLEQGTLVRFSVGLEDVRDLQQDISQALRVLR
jgi:cystathionine beta-lyase